MTPAASTLETRLADCQNRIRAAASPENRAGMARFGITVDRALGVQIPVLRTIARDHRRDHELALALWATGGHEERLLAGFVDDPAKVTPEQMDAWVADFDSWDLCDQVVSNLLARTPHARDRLPTWIEDEREYVRRAGFVVVCALAVHDKAAPDETFLPYLPLVEAYAHDDRNFVKKAVNWALRQIGKRSPTLRTPAIACAERLAARRDPPARWIGRDALRELNRPPKARRTKAGAA